MPAAISLRALCPPLQKGRAVDGLQDETKQGDEAATKQPGAQDDGHGEAAQTQVGPAGDVAADQARSDYETALKERDAKIAALEGEIAEAAKTADAAEKLRAEMDKLRRQGEEQRIGFELQLAGGRNVKAARALLPDHDNDIEKPKAAEPWLFGELSAAPAPAQTGTTGLRNAGAATDEGATMKRWREIAGLDEK